MAQQAQNDHYADARTLALGYAEAVNEELRDLKAAGADVVQIDEPYLQARPEQALEYAIEAINRALEGVDGDTVLHTCFGYAHIVHERLPGYPFIRELQGCVATHLSLEAAQPDLDPEVLLDVRTRSSCSASSISAPRGGDGRGRRGANPPGAHGPATRATRRRAGLRMKYLSRVLAYRKLEAMVAGAKLVREELGL